MRVAGKLMGSVTRDSWARLAHSACGGGHRSPGNGLASVITTRSLGRAAMGCTHAGCPGSGGTEGREEKVGGIPDYFGGVPREWCMRSSKDSLQIGSKYQGLSWEGSISPGRLTRFWWRWDRRGPWDAWLTLRDPGSLMRESGVSQVMTREERGHVE